MYIVQAASTMVYYLLFLIHNTVQKYSLLTHIFCTADSIPNFIVQNKSVLIYTYFCTTHADSIPNFHRTKQICFYIVYKINLF